MDPVYLQLMDDLKNPKQQVCVLCLGVKAAGKSTKACALIRYCLENNLFDEYFMFLPAFQKEIEGSFQLDPKLPWQNNYFLPSTTRYLPSGCWTVPLKK